MRIRALIATDFPFGYVTQTGDAGSEVIRSLVNEQKGSPIRLFLSTPRKNILPTKWARI